MTNIIFNEKKARWEGFVDGKLMVRSARKEFVERKMRDVYGVAMSNVASSCESVIESKEYFGVDERFQFIEQFVSLVARKVMHSLIITGDGGLGKTYTVMKTLEKHGLREDTIGEISGDFIVIKGYSTAKALYRSLWENNGKIIIFDDADSAFKDLIGANLLKAALESSSERVITWGAEFSDREELPNRFKFTGRVIFISNLPQSKFPQALLSRSLRIDLTLSVSEKVVRIEHVMNEVSADIEDKNDVIEFIKKYASKATDLNIRSALTVLKLRQQFGRDFERIALYNFIA
jgi:hypothetical protein